ncbi:Gfo/Idh/MocA family protein [Clostridium folliculivorans]|uniref:Oxidoreductase n=1 Tax=Clostridium folliculivorans TaxID=2886038 RepID=A0A9W5Y564_9CLOT|nr:Gfo/Idh/MocA family oxidoreductase [Clostridium folliculivorans]GKU26919.1 oxidoreductase [Clostridium folliculivorans]GKU31570.1 oxidoreductase [Clostridium folliculivorans]
MSRYKFAIIGCGRISYKHVEAIANNRKEGQLVAVCDIVLENAINKANEYKKLCPEDELPKVYTDYKAMIANEEIHIVTVATESGYHAEISIDCMNKGLNIICEKPIALSIKDADRMIECANKNNVKLCVSHQNRFNTSIQKLRSAVEHNKFGRILNGTARILWNRNMDYYKQAPWRGTWELDGGTLMNQCIHNIDLLQWMLGGEVESVYSQCDTFMRDIDGEDFGAVLVRFKNGAIGIIEGSACVYPKNLKETLDIFGEKGTVSIGGLAVNKVDVWRFEEVEDEGDTSKELEKDPDTVYGFGHTPLFKDVIEAVKENREPYVNGVEGRKAMSIILAAYKSRLTGMPVSFPMDEFSTIDMKAKF